MPDERAAEAEAPVAAEIEPIEITDELFADLTGKSLPVTAPQEHAAEVVAPEPAMPANVVTTDQMQALLSSIDQRIAQATASGQSNASARKSIADEIAEQNPEINRDAIEFLVKNTEKVMASRVAPVVKVLADKVGSLEQQLQSQQSDSTLAVFNSHLESLFDQAKIDDPFDRQAMRALVTQEGLRTYGQKFDLPAATKVFTQLNSHRVKTRHSQTERHTARKQEATANTPPVRHGDGRIAAADFTKRLREDTSKGMSFTGGKFQEMVRQFVSKADKAVG
jgi:hypothetical protein